MRALTGAACDWPLVLVTAATMLAATVIADAEENMSVYTWQRREHTLTSARQYDNPYADVSLRVHYTGPDGRRLDACGFWDGGQVFRIRCAFPAPGVWQWETECSDAGNAGLHQQRGTVVVAPCRGDNVLYRRGFLKVSQNGRYLTHGDGSPFLWIRHEPHKPVINLEAMYDGQGENGWQAVDARSLAWRSWLWGAKGYTYGAGDTPPKCPRGGGVWR